MDDDQVDRADRGSGSADEPHAGGIHHLELCASDLAASVAFWGWLLDELGYEPKSDWDGGRSWLRGSTYVVLKRADEDEPFDRTEPGLNHVAFHAASREQVDRVTEGVRGRDDASLLYEDQHPYAGGYYEDPEGVKVELVAPD